MQILLLLGLSAIAVARPDVGLGYHYHPPSTSYGVPSGSIGNLNQQQQYYYSQQSTPGTLFGSVSPTIPSTTFEVPIYNAGRFGADSQNSQFSTTSHLGGPVPTTFFQPSDGSVVSEVSGLSGVAGISGLSGLPGVSGLSGVSGVSGLSGVSGVSGISGVSGVSGTSGVSGVSAGGSDVIKVSGLSNRYETKTNTASQSNSFYQQQQGDVEKHLYFFAAPDEPETIRSRIVYPQVPSKKNVKVIFIKTPSYNIEPIQVPLQPQHEEKTKIYVLVKKPDDLQLTAVPSVQPTEQTKPEVYFVKYNNQQEAEQAISSLQSGGSAGQNANILEKDSDLINTIAKDTEKKYDLDTRYFRDGGSEDVGGGSVGLAALHQNGFKDESLISAGVDATSSSALNGGLTISGLQDAGKVTVFDTTQSSLIHQQSPSSLNVDFNGSLGDGTLSNVYTQIGSSDSVSLATKGSFPTIESSTIAPELQQFYLPSKLKK